VVCVKTVLPVAAVVCVKALLWYVLRLSMC
jgi:hypothetical protein